MRNLITLTSILSLSLSLILACAPIGQSRSSRKSEKALSDVASPDEVARELGLDQDTPSSNESSAESRPEGDTEEAPKTLSETSLNEAVRHFPVVIVVNKSTQGDEAQTLALYHQGTLAYQFPVSTGREKKELAKSGRRYFSTTPVGWFSPTQTFEAYFSNTWLAWMNYSVFFVGGIAIHATTPSHYDELGMRASGGCVRLREEHAKIVYDLILSEGKGRVPQFTRSGNLLRDSLGKIKMKTSWNTLIIVENEANDENEGVEPTSAKTTKKKG